MGCIAYSSFIPPSVLGKCFGSPFRGMLARVHLRATTTRPHPVLSPFLKQWQNALPEHGPCAGSIAYDLAERVLQWLEIKEGDDEKTVARKKKLIKSCKSKMRFQNMDLAQKAKADNWHNFVSGKGKKKKTGFFTGMQSGVCVSYQAARHIPAMALVAKGAAANQQGQNNDDQIVPQEGIPIPGTGLVEC
eukprot:scaffold29184_cov15-Tisochrysis_lutea.AAC.1